MSFKTIQQANHGFRQSVVVGINFIATTPVASGRNEGKFRVNIANMPVLDDTKTPTQVIALSLGQLQQLADTHSNGSVASLISLVNATGGTTKLRMDMVACHEGETYTAFDGVTLKTYLKTHWNTELYSIEFEDFVQAKLMDAGINNSIAIQQSEFNNSMANALSIGEKIAARKKAERARIAALESVGGNGGEIPEPAGASNDNSDPSDDNDSDDSDDSES